MGLALTAFVVIGYGISLSAPLMFDDIPNLVDNPLMQFNVGSLDGWRSATLSGESGTLLRPVSMFSFAANYALAGAYDPVALKATNLLIHLICAFLVYRLARLLFCALGQEREAVDGLALLAAAIWVLHPLHVSTVLYAVQRMAQLSTLFVLLGLVVYGQYRTRWLRDIPRAGEVAALLLWGALITLFATLSKENGILLPWLALLLEAVVFRGRFAGREYPVILYLAVSVLLLPVFLVAVTWVLRPEWLSGGYGGRDFSLGERVITQLRVLWHYVSWFVWPDIRNMGFQHDDIAVSSGWLQPLTTLLAGLSWLAALAAAVVLRRRFPVFLPGVGFFLVAHALESSVLPLEIAFEHRNYLPSVGLAILLAGLLDGLAQRLPQLRARVLVAPVLIVLALLMAARAHIWGDMNRFARANAINHPHSARAQFFYADALYSQIGRGEYGGEVSDGALLFAARQRFMEMNEMAGGNATALVMLYFSDQFYLAELEDRPDWLAQLAAVLLSDARLTASDYTAIESLVDCAVEGVCEVDRLRVHQLLQALVARFPANYRLLELHYRIAAAAGLESDRISALRQIQALAPRVPTLYSYALSEAAAAGNRAGVYIALAGWMASDRVRKYLPLQRHVAVRDLTRPAASEAVPEISKAADQPW